jgi:hypothetical protein
VKRNRQDEVVLTAIAALTSPRFDAAREAEIDRI